MKKIVFLMCLAVAVHHAAPAQTVAEWLRQKSTQKKFLLQQIAALQVYINYAQQGYEIAGKGVTTIQRIRQGDFDQHRAFFQSWEQVSPAIRNDARIAQVIGYQTGIIKQVNALIGGLEKSDQFTSAERTCLKNVCNQLLTDCIQTVDDLITVVTSGEFRLKDNERLHRVDALYTGMQEKYAFCKGFCNEVKVLSIQRLHEKTETAYSKIINGAK